MTDSVDIERIPYLPGYHIADEGVLPVEVLFWASDDASTVEACEELIDKLNASLYVNGWINNMMVKASEERE